MTVNIALVAAVLLPSVAALASPMTDKWRPLPAGSVKVGGEIGRRIDLTLTNNVLKVDVERVFLNAFTNKVCKPGTYLAAGKMFDALVAYARYTASPEVIALKRRFRDVIAGHQEPDGYAGVMPPTARMAMLWDIHEQGYILQALVNDAAYFADGVSRAAAVRLGDYFISAWKTLPADWGTKYVGRRLGSLGMPQGMVMLYNLTGERKYLDFAVDTWGLGDWNEPIVLGRDELVHGHVYSYLAYCLGQQDLFRIAPDERYLRASKRAMEMIFDGHAAVVSGEVGIDECWTDDQNGGPGLGETCTGVYQMFNYDSLLRLGVGDAVRLGDAMERTLYNAIFAAQSADGRWIRYYTPLLGRRKYFKRDDYCCPTNFRRLMPRLPQYVFYRRSDAVLANLYTPCEAVVEIGGVAVTIRETTTYPNDGKIVFTLSLPKSTAFGFSLRIPRWCAHPSLSVNGESMPAPVPGALSEVRRVWKDGDRIVLDLPMEVRCIRGHRKQSGMFAVARGPLVYGLSGKTIMRRRRIAPGDNSDAFALQRDKAALKMSVYELGNALRIDPRYLSFEGAQASSFRPGGTAITARINTDSAGVGVSQTRDPVCTLTEFADPDNEITFYRMPGYDSPVLVEDEIFK